MAKPTAANAPTSVSSSCPLLEAFQVTPQERNGARSAMFAAAIGRRRVKDHTTLTDQMNRADRQRSRDMPIDGLGREVLLQPCGNPRPGRLCSASSCKTSEGQPPGAPPWPRLTRSRR